MEPDIIAFREGCIWGFELFSHWEKETGNMVHTLNGGKTISVEKFRKEVEEGRWDEVIKNRLAKKIVV